MKSVVEYHNPNSASRLNWLRASVLGANDGIVSVAGAISMAAGEYVSVSSQRDSERALLEKELYELRELPEQELEELTTLYVKKGLSRKTAELVAKELTEKDAFAAHVDVELNIDPENLTSPWHASLASAVFFGWGYYSTGRNTITSTHSPCSSGFRISSSRVDSDLCNRIFI